MKHGGMKLLALAVVVAAVVASASVASADSAREPDPWPDGIRSLAYDDALDPAEVKANAAFEGVSLKEAERRMRLENAAAQLQFDAELLAPETFGGLWIERDPFGVVVAYTSGAEDKVAELAALFPEPSALRAATVAQPRWRLRSLTAEIVGERQMLRNGNPPHDMPESLVRTGGHYDVWTDVAANTVGISVPSVSTALRDAVRARYRPQVTVHVGSSGPSSCTPETCNGRFVGGVRTLLGATGGTCTLGFNTYSDYGETSDRFFAMSAGHCHTNTNNSILRYTKDSSGSWHYYGDVKRYRFSGSVDAEAIRAYAVDEAHVRPEPRIVVDNGRRDISDYVSRSQMAPGTLVGKTGARTGTTRGDIVKVDLAPGYIPSANATWIQAEACVNNGDSGGPVFRSNDIWGIVSGKIYWSSDGCAGDAGQLIFGAPNYALSALDQHLITTGDLGPPAVYNYPPHASFTQSCLLTICQFDASASTDSDGQIVRYHWNFGDGNTATDTDPYYSYDYLLPGFYNVKLTITDDDGKKDSETHEILVSE